jgi:hypothetical protein
MVDIQEARKKAVAEVMRWPRNKLDIQLKCEQKYQ